MYEQDLVKSYADDLERIEREYKRRMKKMDADFKRHYNDVAAQWKSQQVIVSITFIYCN